MMCQRIGRPPISTMGLGRTSVSSLMRVPKPPARITAFISLHNIAVAEIKTRDGVLLLGASGFFGPALIEAFGEAVLAKTFASRAILGGLRFDARSSSVA